MRSSLGVAFGMAVALALAAMPFARGAGGSPTQGHLSLSPQDQGMRVMWVSKHAAAAAPVAGRVVYGYSASKMDLSAPATTRTYTIGEMCGAPANESAYWVDPGTIYDALLPKLTPGTTVYYSFGDATNMSTASSFHVGPKSNDTTTFLAYGDMGTGVNELNTTRLLLAHLDDVDVIVHVGDIAYAEGKAGVWDRWFEDIAPVASRVPYHVCLGNHEYDWPTQSFKPVTFSYMTDSGGECGIPYDRRFHMPGPPLQEANDVLKGSTNIYHSIDVGLVHVVLLSSEHNMTVGSEQYRWLEADLAAVDRAVTPWVVFGQHRPFYGNTIVRALPEYGIMRHIFEPLLLKYKVDLVLFGHIHQYQRTCRMVDHKCNAAGPVYMVVGTAGATHQVAFLPQPEWMKVQSDLFGITKYKAWNATHLHVQWFKDIDGAVGDDFWVTRS